MNARDGDKLLKLIRDKTEQCKLGIYETGDESQKLFYYLKRHDIEISMFVTEKKAAYDQLLGVPVITMQECSQGDLLKTAVISPTAIRKAGSTDIKFIYLERNRMIKRILNIYQFFKDHHAGFQLYGNLKKKYGDDADIYVFQGKSGDLYNAGVYLKYCYRQNTVLLVIGQACMAVAQLFDFKRVENISLYDAECLVKLYYLSGEDIGITPLHCSISYLSSSIFQNLQLRQGMTLGKMYKYYALNLDEAIKPDIPKCVRDTGFMKKFMKQNGLCKGNTVILSPYANSYMDDQLFPFWEKLAVELIHNGYMVFTNSAGAAEPAIKGTDPLFFDIKNAGYVLETAGVLIALRSGFCDIVSSARCRKIILYCENIWKSVDFFEFHSLKNLELADDCIEIKYDHEQEGWLDFLLCQVLSSLAETNQNLTVG